MGSGKVGAPKPDPVGRKDDGGKRRWDLAPFKAFDGVVDVITFGAKKYAPNNWRAVEHDRYLAALLRHMSAFMQGEVIDPDSGLPHMSHIACNACFLSELGAKPPSRDPQAT